MLKSVNIEIAWVGLGSLGLPMAERVCNSGFNVNAIRCSNHQTGLEAFSAAGGEVVQDIPTTTDVLCLCLPTPASTREFLDSNELTLPNLIIDFGTGRPTDTAEYSKALNLNGKVFIDAPVSGSEQQAESGELTVFAGAHRGENQIFDLIVETVSAQPFYFEQRGQGNKAKLVNQLMHLSIMGVIRESLFLVKELDLPMMLSVQALKASSGSSKMLERFGDDIICKRFEKHFALELANKDLTLINELTRPGSAAESYLSLTTQMFLDGARRHPPKSNFTVVCGDALS